MLHDGLYEQVISKGLDAELEQSDKLSKTAPIDSAEAAKILSKYVAEVVEKGLDNLADNGLDVSAQVELANKIIAKAIMNINPKITPINVPPLTVYETKNCKDSIK